MDRKLIDYLIPVDKEYKEFQVLMESEQQEVAVLWDRIQLLLDNQFVDASTSIGIKRWEEILKLFPTSGESLGSRKFAVLARLNEKLPYTERTLRQQLTVLFGEDGYTLFVDNDRFTVHLKLNVGHRENVASASDLLERQVPANMVIDLVIVFNRHADLGHWTYGYLGKYTHEQLMTQQIIDNRYAMLGQFVHTHLEQYTHEQLKNEVIT